MNHVSERVTKPALGRGLGPLMRGTKTPPPAPSAAAEGLAPKPEGLSPGMAALVRGNGAGQPQTQPGPQPPGPSRARRLVRASLLVADLLLVGLAVRVVVKAEGLLDLAGIALCIFAMALGAWLFWLASRLE